MDLCISKIISQLYEYNKHIIKVLESEDENTINSTNIRNYVKILLKYWTSHEVS